MHARLFLAAGLMLASVPAGAEAPRKAVARVSVPFFGAGDEYGGGSSCVSADGRYVAFDSYADNIVPGDNNRTWDVFRRDMETGATQRVSVTSGGLQANGPSHSPAMTPDGRFIAFWSRASNLVAGDTNNAWDVFLRDMQDGSVRRVTLTSGQVQSTGDRDALGRLSLSDDGRYVAFTSASANLVSGDSNSAPDVFVRDTVANTTIRVSVSTGGAQGSNNSGGSVISGNGRYVAFASYASNLAAGDTNGTSDIFLRDLQASTTRRISASASGAEANGWSGEPSISGDGRYVAFESYASNLAPGDAFQTGDIFVKDTLTGAVNRAGAPPAGSNERGSSYAPRLSGDGQFLAFLSAQALVDDDYGVTRGLYVRNLQTGDTTRVSLPVAASGAGFRADLPAISADGRFLAFQSDAEITVGEATLHRYDVYLRDLSVPIGPPLSMADAADALRIAAGLSVATQQDALRLGVTEPGAGVGLPDALAITRTVSQ